MIALLINIIAVIALTVVLVEDRNTRSESLFWLVEERLTEIMEGK